MKISATLINKNEEDFLEMTLKSIRDEVDEIVIVDTGSTDNSIPIAKKYADKILETEWKYDFGYHRNQALDLASNDWVLVVAGDCPWIKLGDKSFHDIANIVQDKGATTAVFTHFEFWFELPVVSWAAIQSGNNGPLFDRNKYRWYGEIHEMLSSKEPGWCHDTIDERGVRVNRIEMPTTVSIVPPIKFADFAKHHYRYLKKDEAFALRNIDYNMVYFGEPVREMTPEYINSIKEKYKTDQKVNVSNIPSYSCNKVATECCNRTSEQRIETHLCTGPFPEGLKEMDWVKWRKE